MAVGSSRGREWERIRQRVLARDNYLCVVPGCNAQATHVDHIIPKVAGGTDEDHNLQAMCREHNLKKGAAMAHRQTWLNPRYFTNTNGN